MAIDLTNPAVRPPRAREMQYDGAGRATMPAEYDPLGNKVAGPGVGVGEEATKTQTAAPAIAPPAPRQQFDRVQGPAPAAPGAPGTAGYPSIPAPTAPPPRAAPAASPGGVPAPPLARELDRYALDALRSPSRFDLDLVRQGTDIIDRELGEQQQRSARDLDEFVSSRGLVGSNIETEERRRMLEGLEDQRMRRLFDLNMAMATTHSADRASAGHLGSQIAGMQQQESQFARSMGQRESEFARNHDLNERQFTESQRQFSAQMSEQIASRLQQESQFARNLGFAENRFAVETGLRERSIDLQEQGMNMDEAFRRASLDMENTLRTRAIDLQERGMDEDNAYRYAALEQDGNFRDRALELQEAGMNLDEAYRQSALEYQSWAAEQGLILDRARIGEAARQGDARLALQAISSGVPGVDVPDIGYPGLPAITPPPGSEQNQPDVPSFANVMNAPVGNTGETYADLFRRIGRLFNNPQGTNEVQ